MGRSTWKYQVFFLFSLILHSQLPFPSSLSSSLSSMPPCSALLRFSKSFSLKKFASLSDTSYPKTASWREDKHCCSWDGVECDKNTSHVVGLDLSSSWLMGHIHSNSTLFFLPNLRRLNLADNWFNDSLIPSEFGNFKSLAHLNLSDSIISGQIPFEISQLSSLLSLDLSKNWLLIKAPVWKRVIGNLTQLRELILDTTNMSSIRPNSLMNLSSSLTTLSLQDCDLRGNLKNYILCLPSIQTLDLSLNELLLIEAPVWKRVIGNLTQLRELILDYTNLSSIRPDSLMNLSSSLTTLSLRACDLRGKLENNILCLPSIQTLDLTGNWNLEGSLLKSNWSSTSLNILGLSGRMFSREFLNSIGNLKSLKHLALYDCNFTGSIPAWLGNLTKLTYLDLSSNSFSGLLPSSLFNLPNLSTLSLGNNQFVGPLPSHLNVIVGVGINIRPKISSTLDRRYHEIFNEVDSLGTQRHQQNTDQIPIGGQWQLIIKLAGAKRKRAKRSAYAYEARNLQGEVVFCGIRSCATGSIVGAVQEAIVEAAVKAKNLGYQQILMLSNCKKLVQVVDKKRAPDWKERTLMADMSSLQQMGLDCRLIFVSKVILNYVWSLAVLATKEPTYYCWPTMEHDVNATYG